MEYNVKYKLDCNYVAINEGNIVTIVGPFHTFDEGSSWGQQWQLANDDNPNWSMVVAKPGYSVRRIHVEHLSKNTPHILPPMPNV